MVLFLSKLTQHFDGIVGILYEALVLFFLSCNQIRLIGKKKSFFFFLRFSYYKSSRVKRKEDICFRQVNCLLQSSPVQSPERPENLPCPWHACQAIMFFIWLSGQFSLDFFTGLLLYMFCFLKERRKM